MISREPIIELTKIFLKSRMNRMTILTSIKRSSIISVKNQFTSMDTKGKIINK